MCLFICCQRRAILAGQPLSKKWSFCELHHLGYVQHYTLSYLGHQAITWVCPDMGIPCCIPKHCHLSGVTRFGGALIFGQSHKIFRMHHTTHEETLQFTAFKLRAPQRLHQSRLQLSPGSKMLFSPAPLKLCFSVLTVFHVLGIPAQILFDSPSFLCVPRPVASWTAVSERSLPGCSSYHSDPWLPIKSLNIKREKQTLLAMVLGSIAMVCRMTEPLWPWSRWLFRKEITLCLIPSISKDQKCCTPLEHEFVPLRLPSTYSRRHRAQNQGKLPAPNQLFEDRPKWYSNNGSDLHKDLNLLEKPWSTNVTLPDIPSGRSPNLHSPPGRQPLRNKKSWTPREKPNPSTFTL